MWWLLASAFIDLGQEDLVARRDVKAFVFLPKRSIALLVPWVVLLTTAFFNDTRHTNSTLNSVYYLAFLFIDIFLFIKLVLNWGPVQDTPRASIVNIMIVFSIALVSKVLIFVSYFLTGISPLLFCSWARRWHSTLLFFDRYLLSIATTFGPLFGLLFHHYVFAW